MHFINAITRHCGSCNFSFQSRCLLGIMLMQIIWIVREKLRSFWLCEDGRRRSCSYAGALLWGDLATAFSLWLLAYISAPSGQVAIRLLQIYICRFKEYFCSKYGLIAFNLAMYRFCCFFLLLYLCLIALAPHVLSWHISCNYFYFFCPWLLSCL